MFPFSSSTFSSERAHARRPNSRVPLGRFLSIVLWTVGALILIDVAVGRAFHPPADPRRASSLQTYFDYGRSIEGKLRREVGSTPEQDAAIVKAGWIANECNVATSTPLGKLGFDIYGMSFSNQIADYMERLDLGLASQRFGGPAAPPNHSYACFIRRVEAGCQRAPIQILGVLASSVRRMETISGLTTSFEAPQPFTYPRYSLTPDGQLEGHSPSIATQDDLRAALADPMQWRAFLDELAANDAFYVEQLVRADIFDHSVIARMIRRAWGQRFVRDRTAALRATDGFSGAPDIAPVLRAILLDFAAKARKAAERPIVILIEDQGYGSALSAMVTPALQAKRIDFVATSTIVSPDDAHNFEGDGHFIPEANEKIARAVLNLLDPAP
jgi:hypothetical protein